MRTKIGSLPPSPPENPPPEKQLDSGVLAEAKIVCPPPGECHGNFRRKSKALRRSCINPQPQAAGTIYGGGLPTALKIRPLAGPRVEYPLALEE